MCFRNIGFVLMVIALAPFAVVCFKGTFQNYVRNYEFTSAKSLFPAMRVSTNLNRRNTLRIVSFSAFNKNFHITLNSFHLSPSSLRVYGVHGVLIESSVGEARPPAIFRGHVNGDKTSLAEGMETSKGMSIMFHHDKNTYIMEPSSFFFNDTERTNSSVVYKMSDVSECGEQSLSVSCTNRNDVIVLKTNQNHHSYSDKNLKMKILQNISSTHRSRLKIHKPRKQICELELVVDPTFAAHLNYNVSDIITALYFFVRKADSVFKRTDFDADGSPDHIRLIPVQISIYFDKEASNYPMVDVSSNDASGFIIGFSRRVQYFCLSICFCHRCFEKDTIGMAFRAEVDQSDALGGICERPVELEGGVPFTANTAVVSTCSHHGRLPLPVIVNSFIHELGHSFGSDHDPLNDSSCSPGGESGNYVMHHHSLDGSKMNHDTFSKCSKKSIQEVINQRAFCLKTSLVPFCGNGITEEGEECDCGDPGSCEQIDRCCTPKGGFGTDSECTLRRSQGAECSAENSPCCSENCKIVRASEQQVCLKSTSECAERKCDGLSAECPVGLFLEDGAPCSERTYLTCRGGKCNSTVCRDNGLQNCICSQENECHVCCLDPEFLKCRTAASFGFLHGAQEIYRKPIGTPCQQNTKVCNRFAQCVDDIKDMEYSPTIYMWYTVLLLAAILLVSSMYVMCFRMWKICRRRQTNVYVLPNSSGVQQVAKYVNANTISS